MSGAWDAEAREILSARLEGELEIAVATLGRDRAYWLEWLAHLARMPVAELERYVTGDEYPCPRKLATIAVAVGTTPDHLMRREAA